jgi:hypothetical protein
LPLAAKSLAYFDDPQGDGFFADIRLEQKIAVAFAK